MKEQLKCVLPVLLLLNCTSNLKLSKEYSSGDFRNKSLTVRFVDDSVYINYVGNLENEFGIANTNLKIKTFLMDRVIDYLKPTTYFSPIITSNSKLEYTIKREIKSDFKGEKEKFDTTIIRYPNYVHPKYPTDTTDVTLFFENTKILSYPGANVLLVGFMPVAALPSKPLVIKSLALFWDNKKNRVISSGNIEAYVDDKTEVTLSTWRDAIIIFCQKLLDKMPFSRYK